MFLTIVTGLSGAGKTSALKALEDIGFFCSDNMPPVLIPQFADLLLGLPNPPQNVAVAVDMRTGKMFDQIYATLDQLRRKKLTLGILFLDASDEELVKRFKFTRRKHPVSGSGKIIEGILMERAGLQRIKELANRVIDTSTLSDRRLADVLSELFGELHDTRLQISVITFGYKRGIPIDADLVFDMRFIPNPYYIDKLKTLNGLSKPVRDYVLKQSSAQFFLESLTALVSYLAPCFLQQDRKQLIIGIGCTGGMHRSVAMGEELYRRLSKLGCRVSIEHRDLRLEAQSVAAEPRKD